MTSESEATTSQKYNIKCMIRIMEFERWFETVYARPLNVLRDPRYVESGELKSAFKTEFSRPRVGRF
uniref:Uncharacterized protein n=1 Tax=Romanomermis culicivorax TaxID=13658 RepID=A0A915I7N9_ROMCU